MKAYWYIILLGLISASYGWAQTRSDLEKKRRSLNQEIYKTNKLLSKTRSNQKATAKKLTDLELKIGSSTKRIEDVAQGVGMLDTMIDRKMGVVEVLEDDLTILKNNYKKLVRQLYRDKLATNSISFLWSSSSFNEVYQRWVYLQHLEDHRVVQAKMIAAVQQDLTERINSLEEKKAEKDSLLQQEMEGKRLLDEEKRNKATLIAQLKHKESRLRADLKRKKRYKIQLSKKIEKAILQQIAAAKEAARKYKQQQAMRKKSPMVSPAPLENKQSRSFAQQKGRLMSPIYQGTIVGYYGRRHHPLFQDVLIENNGIDIKGQYNSVVRNVYQGQVVSIFTIPGFNNAVMVKHGNYYTTYSNVAKVYVKKGQYLKTGGQIGTIGRDSNAGGHVLHFEIWHNKRKENPANWIKG